MTVVVSTNLKVDDLERQVRDVQQSANASLTSTRATTEEQLAALRCRLYSIYIFCCMHDNLAHILAPPLSTSS